MPLDAVVERLQSYAVTYPDLVVEVSALLQGKAQLVPFQPNAACALLALLQCRLQLLPGRVHTVIEQLI